MSWDTASGECIAKLERSLNIYKHLCHVAQNASANVPPSEIDSLAKSEETARKQLDRLKKKEFRIAVVGLEKAGKSTFVNAWLGCDLLPTDSLRCTYTPTQIFGVANESDQRLEVIPKTQDEFGALINELQSVPTTHAQYQNAQKDLSKINEHRSTLNQAISNGFYQRSFLQLDEIREDLWKYVADVKYAHAIKEVKVWTTQLVAVDGVAFYDVPGMDSGLAKTTEDNKRMLSDCDALIVIMRDPSIKGNERDLVNLAVHGDNIPLKDKLFVFMSRADVRETPTAWQDDQRGARESWHTDAGVDLNLKRFIGGSAGAHLALTLPWNALSDKAKKQLPTRENALAKMATIFEVKPTLEEVLPKTGILELKSQVKSYLDSERVEILEKRVEAIRSDIEGKARLIYDRVSKLVPNNPEDFERLHESDQLRAFDEWWGHENKGKWADIRGKLNEFYDTNVFERNPETGVKNARKLAEIKKEYEETITKQLAEIPARQEANRKRIFDSHRNPEFDYDKCNIEWRRELYGDVIKTIESLASTFTSNLLEQTNSVYDYVRETLMYGSNRVEISIASGYSAEKEYLEKSLQILFLRFARPLADVLVRAPIGSQTREFNVRQLGADIELFDLYLARRDDIDPAFRQLKLMADHGSGNLLFDENIRNENIGSPLTDAVKNFLASAAKDTIDAMLPPQIKMLKTLYDALQPTSSPAPQEKIVKPKPRTQDDLIREVEGDLIGVEVLLKAALFDATGFGSFLYNELQTLRDNLDKKEKGFYSVATYEWKSLNSKLISESGFPDKCKSLEIDTSFCQAVTQLREALN